MPLGMCSIEYVPAAVSSIVTTTIRPKYGRASVSTFRLLGTGPVSAGKGWLMAWRPPAWP